MKDRTLICKYYKCKHECEKGRDAVWEGYCTHCNLYQPKRGTKPARTDRRKEKNIKWQNDRRNWK